MWGYTYEDDNTSIVVPVAVILLRDEGMQHAFIFLVLIIGFVKVGKCAPPDFVPIGNGGCGLRRHGARKGSGVLFLAFFGLLVHILDGDGGYNIGLSGVDSNFCSACVMRPDNILRIKWTPTNLDCRLVLERALFWT